MISVKNAIALVRENACSTTQNKTLTIQEALHYVLAQDVYSAITMPPFRQSAMDGYALHLHNSLTYIIIGEIQAGASEKKELKPGEAVRIFTGAAVPDSANAVIMQEKTTTNGTTLHLTETIKPEANIRPIGEQIKQGDLALQKGHKITPASIGFLASLGVTNVSVFVKPKVAVVATGNELIKPGEPLAYGKIYESNSVMLESALKHSGFYDVETFYLSDTFKKTLALIQELEQQFDVILLSGGISVGDYDFVGKAMNRLEVQQVFYKVKQKPGKPLYFGVKNKTMFFGLPGNPASTLSCFYNYVIPALELFQGNKHGGLPIVYARATSHFIKKGSRAQFLKAHYQNGEVTILEGQASSMLHTFARANALVFIPEEQTEIKKNQTVTLISLPR